MSDNDNVCCPYFVVLTCADTNEHKHIGCTASLDDGPLLWNSKAKQWCLEDFKNCPHRPRGENGGMVR